MTAREQPALRQFRPTDLFAVKSLVHRTIATCYPGHYCLEAVRFFTSYHNEQAIVQDAHEGYTLVLEKAGRILGTGTLAGDEIRRVFVEPGLQKHGLGRLIMQRLEDRAESLGMTTIKLDASLPAKPFYDRLGYATIEEASRQVENNRYLEFFRMQKAL
jgi:GNAT superfamily N-acetyltransferase